MPHLDNRTRTDSLRAAGGDRRSAYGETLSRAMSLVETAKMNGHDRQAWLAEILDRIHNHVTNPLNELLSWNWTPMN